MRQFFLTLPRELIEAARIDGANQFTIFWRVALPLAKPALASAGHHHLHEHLEQLFSPPCLFEQLGKDDSSVGNVCSQQCVRKWERFGHHGCSGCRGMPGPRLVPRCSAPDHLRDGLAAR